MTGIHGALILDCICKAIVSQDICITLGWELLVGAARLRLDAAAALFRLPLAAGVHLHIGSELVDLLVPGVKPLVGEVFVVDLGSLVALGNLVRESKGQEMSWHRLIALVELVLFRIRCTVSIALHRLHTGLPVVSLSVNGRPFEILRRAQKLLRIHHPLDRLVAPEPSRPLVVPLISRRHLMKLLHRIVVRPRPHQHWQADLL